MSVVDKRVVEMSFDNSNFEKNVKTTIKTTEQLKKSLSMDGVGKGLQDVDKAANSINLSKIADAAEHLQKRFSVMGEIGHQAIMKMVNSLGSLATKMTSFVKEGIVSGGIKRAMNLENANFMLQGLLKDETQVAAVMKDVSKSVDGTAYSLDAAAKVASMFAATGMRAGDQMYGALRGVAGVAAMTNAEYEQIGLIFTQVAGQGRLMGDQLLQLSTRGINAAATLTNYMNRVGITANATEADVRKMVSEGKISFELFAAAMDDAFGEHALKANETFNGALSNVRSALARIGAEFISPLIVQNGALVKLFNNIRVKINDVKAAIVPFAKSVTDAILRLATSLSFFIKTLNLTPAFTVISNSFQSILNIFKSFGSILSPIAKAFAEVFPRTFVGDLIKVTGSFKDFTASLSLNFEQSLKVQSVFKAIFTIIGKIGSILMPVVGAGLKVVGNIFKSLGDIIIRVTGFVGQNVNSFIAWVRSTGILSNAFTNLKTAIQSVAGKLKTWFNEFIQLPAVQKGIEVFKTVVQKAMDILGRTFNDSAKVVKNFITKLKDIKNLKFSDVVNLFTGIKDAVVKNLGGVVTSIFEKFKATFENMKNGASTGASAIGKAFDLIRTVVTNVVNTVRGVLENLPVGNFVAVGFGAAILYLFKKIKDAVSAFAGPVEAITGLIKGATNVLNGAAGVLNSFSTKVKAEAVFTIAKAIGILAASLFVLSQIPPDRLMSAGIALGAIGLGIVGLSAAMGAINSIGGGLQGSGKILFSLAGSLFILVMALKKIQELDMDTIGESVGLLAGLAGGMIIAMAALSKLAPEMSKNSFALIAFAGSIKILIDGLKELSGLDADKVEDTMPMLITLMGGLALAVNSARGTTMGSAASLVGAAIAIKLMVGVVNQIKEMSDDDIVRGIVVMGLFSKMIKSVVKSTKRAKGAGKEAGIAMLAFSASILIMIAAIKLLAGMDEADIVKGLAVIAAMTLVFGAVSLMTKLAGKNAKEAGVAMLAFSASMLILSGAIALLAMIDPEGLKRAVTAISILGVVMAGIIASTNLAKDAKSVIITIGIVLALLAAALAGLSFIEPDRLFAATAAMSIIMGMFALVVASTGLAKKANGTIIVIGLVMAGLAGILVLISGLDPQSSIGNAIALGILMTTLAAALFIISHVDSVSGSALAGMAILALVMGEIGLILAVLQEFNVAPSMETVAALSILMLTLTAVLVVLSLVGPAAGAAMAGVGALVGVTTVLGAFIIGLGALMEQFPQLEQFLDTGIPILEKIGYALGNFFGNIIGGFIGGVGSGLEELADHLSMFAIKLTPFMTTMQMMNGGDVISAAGDLATMILKLTAADLISGIASFLSGGASFEDFADKIVTFAQAMGRFSMQLKITPIDTSAVRSAALAGQALADLNASLPRSGGALQSFLGEQDFDKFSEALPKFAMAMGMFSVQLRATPIDPEAIQQAANAGKALAELNNNLPRTGGKLQEFLGEQNFDKFSASLVPFAEAMAKFSDVFEANPIDEGLVSTATNAGKALSELNNSLPSTGGVLQEWLGEKMDLGTFGEHIKEFGKAMVAFNTTLALMPINEEVVNRAIKAGEALSALQNSLPNTQGKIAEWFGGDMNLTEFGQHITAFGTAMVDFSAAVKDVNEASVAKVVALGQMINILQQALPENSSWFESIFGGGQQSLSSFGSQLVLFGQDMASFSESMANVDAFHITDIAGSLKSITDFISQLATIDTSNLGNFTDTLKSVAETSLDGFLAVFDGAGPRVQTSVQGFISTFLNAISADPNAIAAPFKTLITNAETEIQNGIQKFMALGSKLMDSLMTGISLGNISATVGISGILNAIISYISSQDSSFRNAGMNTMTAYISGIQSQREQIIAGVNAIVTAMLSAINNRTNDFRTHGITLMTAFRAGMVSTQNQVVTSMNLILVAVLNIMRSRYNQFNTVGVDLIKYFARGLNSGKTIATAGANNTVSAAINALKNKYTTFYNAGIYLVQGLARGIRAASSLAVAAAQNLAASVANAANVRLQIHSPSKVGERTGINYGLGVTKGVLETTFLAEEAGKKVGDAVTKGTEETTEKAEEKGKEAGEKIAKATLDAVDAKILEHAGILGDAIKKILLGDIDEATEDLDTDDVDLDLDTDLELDTDTEKKPEDPTEDLPDKVEEDLSLTANQASKFGEIGEESMKALIEGIKKGEQALIDAMTEILDKLVETISSKKEEINKSGEGLLNGFVSEDKNIIDSFAKSVNDSNEQLVEKYQVFRSIGTKLLENMLIGIEEQAWQVPRVFISFINAAEIAIRSRYTYFYAAGQWLGEGVVKGIESKIAEARAAAERLANAAKGELEDVLQIHSPSRVGERIGGLFDIGFANGILKLAGYASDAAAEMSSGVLNVVFNLTTELANSIDENLDSSPVITPVLDLSEVSGEAAKLNTMLDYVNAMDIGAGIEASKRPKSSNQNGEENGEKVEYNFTQNNYSPKALSRLEIYRQTKNVFDMARSAVRT